MRRQSANITPEQYAKFRTEMRRLRKANHLTMSALAEILDCSQVHIGNIERGSKNPSSALIKDIADVFGTTVDAMCGTKAEHAEAERTANGKKLLERRLSRGFKINEVAGFIGTPREAYLDMEAGKCSIPDSVNEALDRLYKVEERVETVEVVKEVPQESPVSMWAIDTVLAHITDIDIDETAQRALFRELINARTSMLEAELFG